MLFLGIVSYAKEDDVLGTWLVKENGKIVEIYKNENGEYTGKIKKDNFIFIIIVKFFSFKLCTSFCDFFSYLFYFSFYKF